MEQEKDKTSRKKFVLWGLGILSSLTALKFMSSSKKKKKETVKMLTQDGRLVEIDKDMIPVSKRKITDPELKAWVKNKSEN
jgi:hypothetical protein